MRLIPILLIFNKVGFRLRQLEDKFVKFFSERNGFICPNLLSVLQRGAITAVSYYSAVQI